MHSHPSVPASRFRRRAFTLIELLTVIAIIGILAAILIPTVSRVRETAVKAKCVARLRQWGSAVGLCANDYKNNVPLFYKNDSDFIYDPYLNKGKMMVEDSTKGGTTRNLAATEAMTQCPNGVKDGGSITGSDRQYAFVIPKDLTKQNAKLFSKSSTDYFFNLAKASAPAKLLLMIENAGGGTQAVVDGTAGIKTEMDSKVRKVQTTSGWIRHGGIANALFLDGHVASLNTTETDYSNNESKEKLDRWFTLN